jgi:hypothetical protein
MTISRRCARHLLVDWPSGVQASVFVPENIKETTFALADKGGF